MVVNILKSYFDLLINVYPILKMDKAEWVGDFLLASREKTSLLNDIETQIYWQVQEIVSKYLGHENFRILPSSDWRVFVKPLSDNKFDNEYRLIITMWIYLGEDINKAKNDGFIIGFITDKEQTEVKLEQKPKRNSIFDGAFVDKLMTELRDFIQ